MSETLILLLPLGFSAAGVGAALAQCGTPACHWSSLGAIALKTRLGMLKAVAPSRRRARVAGLCLASLVGSGGLTAYAAQPAAPERLAAQAAGVVGSGDQLSLRVIESGRQRTLRPGDAYADGWTLDALTPTAATLVKDGQRRQIGLNPTGALAASEASASASQVSVTRSDAELITIGSAERWDTKTPIPGMSLAETQRFFALKGKAYFALDGYRNAMKLEAARAGFPDVVMMNSDKNLEVSALGADGPEFLGLLNKDTAAKRDLAAAAFDRYGPVEVPFTPGRPSSETLLAAPARYPGATWDVREGDPNVLVMVPPNPALYAMLSPTDIKPLDEVARFLRSRPVPGAASGMGELGPFWRTAAMP